MRLRLHGFRRQVGIVEGPDAAKACRANLAEPTSKRRKVQGGTGAALMFRLLQVVRKIGKGW